MALFPCNVGSGGTDSRLGKYYVKDSNSDFNITGNISDILNTNIQCPIYGEGMFFIDRNTNVTVSGNKVGVVHADDSKSYITNNTMLCTKGDIVLVGNNSIKLVYA